MAQNHVLSVEFPQVEPTGAPGNDYQHISTTPDMFGAAGARATESLGQAAEKVGAAGMDALTARQSLQNEVHASETNTWLAKQITDRYAEYGQLEGRAAMDALPKFKDDVEKLYQDSLGTAGSLSEKAMLARVNRTVTDRFYSMATTHATGQFRTWQDKTATDRAAQYGNMAALAADSPDTMKAFLATSDDEVAKLYEQRQWDRDSIAAEVSKNRGRNVKTIVETLARSGDTDRALQVFKANAEGMDAQSRLAVVTALKPLIRDEAAKSLTDHLLGRSEPPKNARAGTAYSFFTQQGWSPAASSALVGHFMVESDLDPRGATGDNGTAHGIGQWREERFDALKRFAAQQGKPWTDFGVQLQFAQSELVGSESKAAAALRAAKTPEEAAEAVLQYERPKNFQGGLMLAADGMSRLHNTLSVYGTFAGQPGQPGQAARLDKGDLFERALTMTEGAPSWLRDKVLANINHEYTLQQTLTAGERAELQQRVPDVIAATEAGVQGLSLPEDRIRAVFPAAKAQEMVDEFAIAQRVGDVMRSTRWATPDELQGMYSDITSGRGALSTMMRGHGRTGATGPGAAGADADADTALYFKVRDRAARQLEKVIAARQSMLTGSNADPAAYVRENPAVADKIKALDPKNPASYDAYATATLGIQEHLGVPLEQQRILTRDVADQLATRWRHPETFKGDKDQAAGADAVRLDIEQTAKLWGDRWPQIYRELSPKLDPTLRVIAAGVEPAAAVALLNSQNVKEEELLRSQDDVRKGDFGKAVVDALKPFARTLTGSERDRTLSDYETSVRKLAAIYVSRGQDATSAADQAVRELVSRRYDYVDTYRVPKTQADGKPFPYAPDMIQEGVREATRRLGERPSGLAAGETSLEAADRALKMTPQERALYQRHVANLNGPGGVDNPDGSRSSLYQSVQEHNGRFYNVPTVWDGKIETEKYTDPKTGKVFDVPNATALANVERAGWGNFPSYATAEEADARYARMHEFMERDTADYMAARGKVPQGQQPRGTALAPLLLATKRDDMGGLSGTYLDANTASSLRRNGIWVTGPHEEGLVLMQPDGFAAARPDRTPLLLTWEQIAGYAAEARKARVLPPSLSGAALP